MKERSLYLDVVKGLAIILVVVGHCIQFGSGADVLRSGVFFADPLFKFIYSFHMPLFMLVSGYLFRYSIQRPAAQVVIAKVRSIVVPLVVWVTLYQVLLLLRGTTIPVDIFLATYFHELWFLRALFVFCMVVLAVRLFLRDSLYAHILLNLAVLFVPGRFMSSIFVFTLPYFTLGYLFNKYQLLSKVQPVVERRSGLLVLATMVPFVLLLCFFGDGYYAYRMDSCLLSNRQPWTVTAYVDIYRHLTAVCGCLWLLLSVWWMMRRFSQPSVSRLLQKLGQAALCIYSVNHILNSIVLPLLPAHGICYLVNALESVGVLATAYAAYVVLKRYSLTRLLFLGGR